MGIDTLTFDLDDTLWDNRPVMEQAEAGHYTWLDESLAKRFPDLLSARGRYADHFPLAHYQARRQAIARHYPARRSDFTWIRRHALLDSLTTYGLSGHDARYWSDGAIERLLVLRHQLTLFDGVESLLASLNRHYRLGAITNGNADLRRLSLDHHFGAIIAAGEMRIPKPASEPFLVALERLGSTPTTAMHIGDSWEDDVLPAHRLGMHVAWIDNSGTDNRPLPVGVTRLNHVTQLPELLAQLIRAGHTCR